MKLSKRLQGIADLVNENTKIADVGCDHGLLDIYLTKEKNVKCIAIDNKQSCLDNAIANIKKYGLDEKIETFLSDGLDKIDISNINTVIISGMGTSTILDIIKDKNISHMIIQSNNNLYELRKNLVKAGYYINNEVYVFEYKYYVIMELKKGRKKYSNFELEFGPVLLKNGNKEYFNYLYNKIIEIVKRKKKISLKEKYYIHKLKKYC